MDASNVDIIVGPKWDRRVIDLTVPKGIDEIAVFVSGGMDSAILFYALSVINPGVNGPKSFFATGSEEKETMVVVLP